MNEIKIMSETLANKIAAGEVVEKCSSIVKELVENSIDANATKVTINLLEGGLKEIEVIDNGNGMTRDDALLAFQRHATSKLYKDDDLFFIDTLGFRGEALPSIASVSRVILKTCKNDSSTIVEIEGGKLLQHTDTAMNQGTSIQISKLFYNTPARLKYLKNEYSELANIVLLLERLALSNPGIAITLTNEGKTTLKTSGSGDLLKTIHEIYGMNISKNMLSIKASSDDFDLNGYICKPEVLKSNRNHMIVMVNGRIIKNYEINKAINDAYYTYKPDSKFPVVVLKIETDPTLIDVNIHPTKQDIKINKMNLLYDLIYQTIKDILYQTLLVPKAMKEEMKPFHPTNFTQSEFVPVIAEETENYEENIQTEFELSPENIEENIIINQDVKKLVLYPVGLVHGTYIVAENENGMYLIDQHAAQERINYEKNMKALESNQVFKTEMLFPFTIEFSISEFMKVNENKTILETMGFGFEEFGINTFIFKSHPTWLLEGYEEESIRKILDLIIGGLDGFDRVKFNEHIAITLSCKMSIKANMHIPHEAQEQLLKDLVQCDNPYNCPHGRPTMITFSNYDLERMFKRVMN